MLSVLVISDELVDREALYINGELRYTDRMISACDISSYITAEPIKFGHDIVRLDEDEEFPQVLEQLDGKFVFCGEAP